MSQTVIVAFTGRKGSGKDTAAEVLFRTGRWGQINFADKLKEICTLAYGLSPDEMSNPLLKQQELSRWPFKAPRFLMQEIAQLLRDEYPEIWVMGWLATIRGQQAPRVVVTDLRYPNEVDVLRTMGVTIVKIERPDMEGDEFSNHESESYFDDIEADITIVNDGTIEDLQKWVKTALSVKGIEI